MNSDDKKIILNLSNKIAELNQSKEVNFEEYLKILEQNKLKCKQNKIIEHLLFKLLKVSVQKNNKFELSLIKSVISSNFNIGVKFLKLYLKMNIKRDPENFSELLDLINTSLKPELDSFTILPSLSIIKEIIMSKYLSDNKNLISKIEFFFINIDLAKLLIDQQFFIFYKYLNSLSLFTEIKGFDKEFSKSIFNKLNEEFILERIEKLECSEEIKEDLMVIFLIMVFKILAQAEISDINIDQINRLFFNENMLRLDLVFKGKDDDLVINFCFLCLKKEAEKKVLFKEMFYFDLDSHVMFLKLCSSVRFDYQVLIDWLISNETNFLEYFLKYLKLLNSKLIESSNFVDIIKNKFRESQVKIEHFKSVIKMERSEKLDFDQMFEALKTVETKIRQFKRSFPYNCEPLLRRLETINYSLI